MAGSRVGLFDNLNIPIHRDAQHREDTRFSVVEAVPHARARAVRANPYRSDVRASGSVIGR
jgi:hypothetical protein